MEINLKLTDKQKETFKLLLDGTHTEVLYGGAKGSGKSYLGCVWVLYMCLTYPGIRALIGRTVLTQLRLTTIKTLLDLFKECNISPEHYTYNQQSNEIKLFNGSEIVFKDLAPSIQDAEYHSLGGLELTIAFVDEIAQVPRQAYDIVKTLLRYKINEYQLTPKLFMSCNPSQNWLKQEFYLKHINGTLEANKVFIQALPTDNPNLPASYIEILKNLPPQQRDRLYYGSWDYGDDDGLFDFDSVTSSFFRFSPNPDDKKYATLDVARFGEDKSVLMIWAGLCVVDYKVYSKVDATALVNDVRTILAGYKIEGRYLIVDSDGVGGPVADMLKGTNFVNNAKALHEQNFTNLKSQCYVKLSELFKQEKISVNIMDPEVTDMLVQELLAVKLKDQDKDNKVSVKSKDDMKKVLGRSPDVSDSMMMRMYFELKNMKSTAKYAIAFV
jgi:hypothetical protein